MSPIKLAAMLMSLAFLCSISAAQTLQPNCAVKMEAPKDGVYGAFVPYTGPLLGITPTKCEVTAPPTTSSAEPRRDEASVLPVSSIASGSTASRSTPSSTPRCEPITPRKDEVYGSFVPYTGPFLGAPKCQVAPDDTSTPQTILSDSPPLDLSAAKGPLLPNNDVAPPPEEATSEYVRVTPFPRAVTGEARDYKPFHSVAVGIKADTLGLGIELATPLSHSFNLRSSYNIFAFTDPFSIDGIDYDARIHLKSNETTLDWFIGHGLHISPGLLYMKNNMSAPVSVGPGQKFLLGSQTYINSVDDPASGSSSVVYPHTFAPMLLIGFGNIIPRSDRRFSIPIEFGAAFTGAPQINVALTGTACTTSGCVNFTDKSTQTNLKQEIDNLNEGLKRYPFFPIVSVGFAYHF